MLKLSYFTILLVFVLAFGRSERYKRDDAKFASDLGGPLAKNSESTSSSAARSVNQTTMDDLYPCELQTTVQGQQRSSNVSDQGNSTSKPIGRKKRYISYGGVGSNYNNRLSPIPTVFQSVDRPGLYQPSFASSYRPSYYSNTNPTNGMPRTSFQHNFRICQWPYRLSAPSVYSQNQVHYFPTQRSYALPQQSYNQQLPPMVFAVQPAFSQIVPIPSSTTTATTATPVVTTTAMPSPDPMEGRLLVKQFDDFVKRFNKTYPPGFDVEKAKRNFEENRNRVLKLGDERRSPYDAQLDVTKFGDENFFDFRAAHTGAFLAENKTAIRKISGDSLQKPKCQKLQWTSKSVFPEVRNQESCGACYAMTTADLLAAQSKIESKNFETPVKPLSAQYLIDCSSEPDAFKCDGGRPINILNRLTKCQKEGRPCMLPAEECYPYTAANNTCNNNCTRELIKIDGAEILDIRGPREMDVMATLLQWGPVIAIVGVTEVWQFYNGTGIIRPRQCSTDLSHAVIVIGYDYTTCVPTYTIRNSWGRDWGGNGYVKLEAGKNTCGVAQSVVYACSTRCGPEGPSFDFVARNPNFPDC